MAGRREASVAERATEMKLKSRWSRKLLISCRAAWETRAGSLDGSMPCWSSRASAWLSWSLVTICEAAEAAMKAASGDTVSGGDMKLAAMVDGLSLDILWALERECVFIEGERMADSGRDMGYSDEGAMFDDSISECSWYSGVD